MRFCEPTRLKKNFSQLTACISADTWKKRSQKTLYVPASILKEGKNEVIVFESDGIIGEPIIEFTEQSDLG